MRLQALCKHVNAGVTTKTVPKTSLALFWLSITVLYILHETNQTRMQQPNKVAQHASCKQEVQQAHTRHVGVLTTVILVCSPDTQVNWRLPNHSLCQGDKVPEVQGLPHGRKWMQTECRHCTQVRH